MVKSSLNFRGLLTYRPRNGPATQIDLLIDRSKASGAVPLHCFYVVDSYLEQLGKSGANDSDIGCLFAHSQLVKRGGQIKLHAIEKIAFPWHRLVCPKADDPQMSLPHRVCEAVLNASKKTEDALSKPEAKVDFFVPPVCERLPNYVTRTLDPEAYKGARRSLAVDLARERNIRGLVLIIDNAETPEMGRPET